MIKILAVAALKVIGAAALLLAIIGAAFTALMWLDQYISGANLAAAVFITWVFCYATWQTAKEDMQRKEQDKGNRP